VAGLSRPQVGPQQVGEPLTADCLAALGRYVGKEGASLFPESTITLYDKWSENADHQHHRHRPIAQLRGLSELPIFNRQCTVPIGVKKASVSLPRYQTVGSPPLGAREAEQEPQQPLWSKPRVSVLYTMVLR
jgi:hypothetical protein